MNPLKKTIDNLIISKTLRPREGRRLPDVFQGRWPKEGAKVFDRLHKKAKEPTASTPQSRNKSRNKSRRSPLPTRFWHKLTFLRHPNTLRWLLGLTIVTTWGYWNGKLLLSSAAGLAMMVLVYRMQQWDWQVRWSEFWRSSIGSNRQLTLAVGSGALATVSVYMSVSIWVDLENHWIASGIILQNLGLAVVIGLLVWLVISHRATQQQAYLEGMLTNLTDPEPLKRLIAVREITRWISNTNFSRNDPNKLFGRLNRSPGETRFNSKNSWISRSHLIECFQMMLLRESEPMVYDAIIDALQALDSFPKKPKKINKPQSFSVSLPLNNYQIHGE
jgi:hypothetical protein